MNPTMSPTSRTHILVGAVLAALQILNGGAALGDVIGAKAFGLFALVVAAFQAGWQFYTSATSIPTSAVAAVVDSKTGTVVAGPAADQPNGTAVAVDTPAAGADAADGSTGGAG